MNLCPTISDCGHGQRAIDAFWQRVIPEPNSGCWLWIGRRNNRGYGLTWADRVQISAHRLSHELFIGPIPQGLTIDHLCFTPACVNPNHIEAVSTATNNARSVARRGGHYIVHGTACRIFCEVCGARLEQLYPSSSKRGCRECQRERSRISHRNNYIPSVRKITHPQFKHTTWHKTARKWQAAVNRDGRCHYVGLFDDRQDAANAASAWLISSCSSKA